MRSEGVTDATGCPRKSELSIVEDSRSNPIRKDSHWKLILFGGESHRSRLCHAISFSARIITPYRTNRWGFSRSRRNASKKTKTRRKRRRTRRRRRRTTIVADEWFRGDTPGTQAAMKLACLLACVLRRGRLHLAYEATHAFRSHHSTGKGSKKSINRATIVCTRLNTNSYLQI